MASKEAGSSEMPDVGENGNIHSGRTHVNRPRDPPGQHSVYILPGDTERDGLNRNIMQPSGLSGVGEPVRHFVSGQNAEIDIEGFAASPASDDMPAQTALWNKVFSEEKFGTQHPSSDMPAQTARIVHPRAARSIVSAMPFRRTEIQDPWDPSQNERQNFENMFPCLCPVNPHMRSLRLRLETFTHLVPK
uniref:Uncharacterized protein n=1 Tax=Ciona intestinalis TaxID=7719 RepID=F6VMW3_CIOIN